MSTPLSRRTMLRGLGVSMALPFLESMLPSSSGLLSAAQAAGTGAIPGVAASAGVAGKNAVAPLRMCMLFMPNGVAYKDWTPSGEGATYELSPTLKALAKVKNDISILSGLALDNARAKGDGPGDHARSAAAFLTAAHPYKTSGKDIRVGVSMDQFAAQQIGSRTRLPSLELSLDKSRTAGNCDSGYSCAYVSNIAWRNETTPVPAETDPGAVFDRLFGGGGSVDPEAQAAMAKRLATRKSVLDFVSEDTKRLQKKLGKADQDKLDEFTTSIREVETRVDAARAAVGPVGGRMVKPDMARPDGAPANLGEHMKLMCDLTVLAWRMDVTRITTLMIARDGSNRSYKDIGVTEGHHSLSHHGGDPEKVAAIKKIDEYHLTQFAYFIEKLKNTPEGTGNMLDQSMIMLGSGIGDGNRHNHDELPIVLAGRAGGLFKQGRHIRFGRNTPLANLYLSILQNMGVKADRFADSDGLLKGLNA